MNWLEWKSIKLRELYNEKIGKPKTGGDRWEYKHMLDSVLSLSPTIVRWCKEVMAESKMKRATLVPQESAPTP